MILHIKETELPLYFERDMMYIGTSQILYIEKEHNEFLNQYFQNTEAFEMLFDNYCHQYSIRYFPECELIYIPQLVKQWSSDVNYLKELSNYNFPSLNLDIINEFEFENINSTSYSEFLFKCFDDSIFNGIGNGLLIPNYQGGGYSFLPLKSSDLESLSKELDLFFKRIKEVQETCMENFSLPIGETNIPEDEKADYDFQFIQIAEEVIERIDKLKKTGHKKLLLKLILDKVLKSNKDERLRSLANELSFRLDVDYRHYNRLDTFKTRYLNQELSPLVIDDEYRIFLPKYNNLEIRMAPLAKAVFLLFLTFPEGILFKELSYYKSKLYIIYSAISARGSLEGIEKSIDDICNPAENSINEKCSRIKESFLSHLDDEIAKNYYITGGRGCPKLILLDRTLVQWDTSLLNERYKDAITHWDLENF